MSRKCRSQFKRVKKKNFSRSFNNSAPYRWETVTGGEGSSRRDGGNIECWLMSVNSQDVEDKHLDKKQTVLGEKDTGNEKKKKVSGWRKVAEANTQTARFPVGYHHDARQTFWSLTSMSDPGIKQWVQRQVLLQRHRLCISESNKFKPTNKSVK